jgi:L-ascorbate metabolism protein UlaG (beta-lactamase superfamily)
MLKIKHIAHSCFLIDNGIEKLIIDPYDEEIGYEPVKEEVNYLLISHNHFDHNHIKYIKIKDNIRSFEIQKINSFHDNQNGSIRGNNIIHLIETNEIKICHLGDLGHILTKEQLEQIQDIDVLLIPIGGVYTIDYKMAIEVIKQINPHAVIPMHYKTRRLNINIDTVDNFIKEIEKEYKILRQNGNEIEYNKSLERAAFII